MTPHTNEGDAAASALTAAGGGGDLADFVDPGATPAEKVELARFLETVDLFSELTWLQCLKLAEAGQEVTLEEGESLFSEGDAGDKLYCVRDGEIALVRRLNGQAESVLARFGPSMAFGEMGLIENTTRTATARAVCPTSLVIFEQDLLDSLLISDKDALNKVLFALVRLFCRRLRTMNGRLNQALRMTVDASGMDV